MEEGFPPPRRVCVERNTMERGKPLLIVSVWKETQWRRGKPLSSHLCGKKHNGEGVSPLSSRLCGRNTTEKGETPPPSWPFKVISEKIKKYKERQAYLVRSSFAIPSIFVPPCTVSLFCIVVPYRVVNSGVWWVK